MEKKNSIDLIGGSGLFALALVLGLNQVAIKVLNTGLQPVFSCGLRSLCAFFIIYAYARWRARPLSISDGTLTLGIVTGILFALEFIFMFIALDYTSVVRVSIFFYSMPIWITLGAHYVVPGERITPVKLTGLIIAMAGVVWAFADRSAGGGSLIGDILVTIGAMCWAAIGLVARVTKFNRAVPEMQLLYQLAVSSVILIPISFFFGPLIRDFQLHHLGILAFMVVVVVCMGFLFFFWVVSIYPPSAVGSFMFLAPVFGVIFGWFFLGEETGVTIIGAVVLVSIGIILINRRPKPRPAG
jgi:drug/metabolite transporter (DMT)-like permease